MSTTSNPYRGFRFPAEIINHAVWLYHCFSLSLRFGRTYANSLKRRRPHPGDKWFLEEVFLRIQGNLYYLSPASPNQLKSAVSVASLRATKA